MAIRNEIKRRAEKLLNMHQKVEDGKNAQAFCSTQERSTCSPPYFTFFTKILWKITEIHYCLSKRYLPLDSIFTKTSGVISSVRV